MIARMSPRRNARTRRLIRALARNYKVRIISERPDDSPYEEKYLDGARLDEIELPFPKFRLWFFTGGLRVVYFNIYSFFIALDSNVMAVVCSDLLYCLPGIIFKVFLRRKYVYNSHEIMWALGNPPFLSNLLGWLEKISIRFCDFWLVPSEERAKLILKKHGLVKPYLMYENLPIVESHPSGQPALSRPFSIEESWKRPICNVSRIYNIRERN